MSESEPGLRCVIAWSDRRNLCSLVAGALGAKMGARGMIQLGDDALVVYGTPPAEQVRDWVADILDSDESVLVLEFETWSGHGPGVDAEWLMRRGH